MRLFHSSTFLETGDEEEEEEEQTKRQTDRI